jgi:hypothetical protein
MSKWRAKRRTSACVTSMRAYEQQYAGQLAQL